MTDEKRDSEHERFLRLFLSSERELYRYVSVLVPHADDAAEIVQETALQLWKKFDEYDISQPFTPWACRFGLNVTRQWMARHQRWASILRLDTATQLVERRMELLAEFDQRFIRLEACLQRLPAEHRELLQGYYWTRDEIAVLAERFKQTVEALYKTLQRVRQRLRICLESPLK